MEILNALKELYKDKIIDIQVVVQTDKSSIYEFILKGKFENPLYVTIKKVKIEGNIRYNANVSHWFRNSNSYFYMFYFENKETLEKSLNEVCNRGLSKYEPKDKGTQWKENSSYK